MGERTTTAATVLLAVALAAPAGAGPQQVPGTQAMQPAAPAAPSGATEKATEKATDEAEAASVPAEAPGPDAEVARAQITSAVVDREPTDTLEQVPNDRDHVYFFTDLRNFQGQDVVHRWEHDGEVVAEVPFGVAGPRWRVYSRKTLDPSLLGDWTVSVVDAEGQVVAQEQFQVVEAPERAAAGPAHDGGESEPAPAAPMP
jgi:hypothetical protein